LALALIIFLATLIERTLFHWSTRKLVSLINRSRLSIEVRKPEVFTFPLRILTYGLALRYGLIWMDLEPATLAILANASHILLTVGTIWLANIAVHLLSQLLEEQAKKTENKFDDLLVPLFRKTAKILIWVAGILLIAKTIWGDIDTILAGFGLGGLAVALAAKDTLANLFGSITVLVDRPFQIGDWVQIGALDGTVEEVGFRSTRIRTFYNSLITIPNSQLTSSSIDNFGARQYRRFKTTLGVTYDTSPDRIEAFCEGIRQLILQRNHTRKDYFHVYLNDFGPSSLNILLYLFFEVPDWSTELAERHRIMIDIIRLAQSLDVQFAFPTQTLHVFQEEFQKPATIGDDPYVWGAHQAKTINQNPLTMSRPRSGIGQGENFPPDQPKTQS
jgi:MscS family membrane protein